VATPATESKRLNFPTLVRTPNIFPERVTLAANTCIGSICLYDYLSDVCECLSGSKARIFIRGSKIRLEEVSALCKLDELRNKFHLKRGDLAEA
jgi:hypothetical protein